MEEQDIGRKSGGVNTANLSHQEEGAAGAKKAACGDDKHSSVRHFGDAIAVNQQLQQITSSSRRPAQLQLSSTDVDTAGSEQVNAIDKENFPAPLTLPPRGPVAREGCNAGQAAAAATVSGRQPQHVVGAPTTAAAGRAAAASAFEATWDPLGIISGGGAQKSGGPPRAAAADSAALQREIKTRLLAYAFRCAISSTVGAVPDAALAFTRAVDHVAASPVARAAKQAFSAATAAVTGGTAAATFDEHAAHFIGLLVMGTAIGAASSELAGAQQHLTARRQPRPCEPASYLLRGAAC